MQVDGGRRIRPGLWVVLGALLVPVGLLLARNAAALAAQVGGVEGAPVCATEFAKGCTTPRPAVLDHRSYSRRMSRATGEQQWQIRVYEDAPGVQPSGLLPVTVPRQGGREELVEELEVTVLYFGRSPAWIRLPSGVVLETEDHPRRQAPLLAWGALVAIGGGAFGVRTAVRARRHGGGWLRPSPARVRVGPDVVLGLVGWWASSSSRSRAAASGRGSWPGYWSPGSLSSDGGGCAAVRLRTTTRATARPVSLTNLARTTRVGAGVGSQTTPGQRCC